MHKTGGVIGIIAGVFAVIAAFVTLMFGGVASAFHAEKASTVVGLGWGGVVFSFLVIVFAALSFSKARMAGWGLIVSALMGAILGGTLVAIFMTLALIAGILIVVSAKPTPESQIAPVAIESSNNKLIWCGVIGIVLIGGAFALVGTHQKAVEPTQLVEAAKTPPAASDTVSVGEDATTLTKLAQADLSGPDSIKLTELGASPPENELATFMRLSGQEKPTEVQTAARAKAVLDSIEKAKGTVVIWDLIVNDIKPAGPNAFQVSTKCADLSGRVTPPAQIQMAQPETDVLLTSRNADENKAVESLAGCSAIRVKGIVAGFDSRTKKVILSPAIIVKAGGYVAQDVRTTNMPSISDGQSVDTKSIEKIEQKNEVETKQNILEARSSMQSSASDEPDEQILKITDRELNRVYSELIKKFDSEKKTELRISELAWIKKKQTTCKNDVKCELNLTKERLVELSNM